MAADRLIILTLIATLVVTYTLNYRNMKNPKVIAKLLLQVMVTFLSIRYLIDFFLRDSEVGIDSDNTNLLLEMNFPFPARKAGRLSGERKAGFPEKRVYFSLRGTVG